MADAPELPEDIEVRTATTAAADFVESFYPALNNSGSRTKLASFYLKPTTACKVDITLNGGTVESPTELQTKFEKDVDKCLYDVQSFDCHVINPNYNVGAPEGHVDKGGKNMSIVVAVNGSVKYWAEGDDAEGEVRGFMDNFVLVPNWAAQGPKAAKGLSRWLVQSHTFRLVM